MKEIEKIKKKKPLLANMSNIQSMISQSTGSTSSPKKQQTMNKRRRRFEEEYVIPEPARHEYFDSSISKFFQSIGAQPPHDGNDYKQHGPINNKSQIVNNIILENIYRMFGITAFPVSDPSKAARRDLLGVRIEIFNEKLKKFETPHYMIFERDVKTSKWVIFKHTIPIFIQIHEIYKEYDDMRSDETLLKYLQRIRSILNMTSLKHQVIESIKSQYPENIQNLQKDIAMETVKFRLKVSDISTNFILSFSLDQVESCYIESGFTESEKFRIKNVIKGDVQSLEKRMSDVIQSLEMS